VPSEELLAAAYEAHSTLFYDAARKRVLLAGPATLLSILWGVEHGLRQDARFRHAQEIGQSAAELHRCLGELVLPLQKLRNSMGAAARSYNSVLDTLDSKVLPQVRQLEELGIFIPGTQLPKITPLHVPVRPVAVGSYPEVTGSSAAEQADS
jgi:DNA recombination protein RmuC